jgi:serine/threonine protein kinase/formylglycine-generating enzyme required for sulfatase activity
MKVCPHCGQAFDDQTEVCSADRSQLLLIEPNESDPMLGRLLDGRYRLIRKIGQGGMGAIYRAVHIENLRICAIKLMTSLSPGKDDAIARFKREARNSVRIDSVHAVTVYDSGETDEGLLFLAMEFIDGKPLSRVIAEQRVLPIERVIHITNQIAEALAAAHALPMIHRDLKPDNIMITRKGSDSDFVKVLDFGIAKALTEEGADNLTKTGFVLGTPVYMSPEQLLGEPLDGRSDIYSLAIIVFEMLSGRLPFEGDNPQAVMMKRVMGQPIRLRALAPSLSEAVESAVMSGLERDPNARIANVEAFATELNRALHSSTQVMGGAVTRSLEDPGAARATREWAGPQTAQTGFESGPVFTGQSVQGTTPTPGGVNTWAATEIRYSPSQHQAIAQTSPSASPTTPPSQSAGVSQPSSVADHPAIAPEAEVISKPARSRKGLLLFGGGFVVLVIAAVVYLILPGASTSGFALVVKGAPAGSKVFIDEKQRDASPVDGALKVAGVYPGKVSIRVSHEGFSDFITTVTGAKGETQTCEAQLLPEIDYNGPMVPIPAGKFIMGDDNHEPDERPAHELNLPAYYIDKYEVSNSQYKKFCDETRRTYPPNPPIDPTYFTSKPDDPVLGVTIDDAVAYASWAHKRLPTEEEWEKAASWDPLAQKKRQFPWGDDFASGSANIGSDHPLAVSQSGGDRSFYGVLNMAGNAGEWVDAPYKPYKGNQTPDPDYDKDDRVMRGGTFFHGSTQVESRTSYRNHLPRVFHKGQSVPVGIRCVIPADDPRIQSLVRAGSK